MTLYSWHQSFTPASKPVKLLDSASNLARLTRPSAYAALGFAPFAPTLVSVASCAVRFALQNAARDICQRRTANEAVAVQAEEADGKPEEALEFVDDALDAHPCMLPLVLMVEKAASVGQPEAGTATLGIATDRAVDG